MYCTATYLNRTILFCVQQYCTSACLDTTLHCYCVYSSLFGLFLLCVQQPVWAITFVFTAACLDGPLLLCVQQPVWTVNYFCVYSSLSGLSFPFVCTVACLDCLLILCVQQPVWTVHYFCVYSSLFGLYGILFGMRSSGLLARLPSSGKTKENTIESKSILHMPYTVHILMGNLVFHFLIFVVDIIDSIYSLNRPDKHCMSLTLSPLQKFIS